MGGDKNKHNTEYRKDEAHRPEIEEHVAENNGQNSGDPAEDELGTETDGGHDIFSFTLC